MHNNRTDRNGGSQDRRTYMTQTPVPRLILELAVPTILSMLVTGIYNTADTFFVGKISTQATAAVGLVFSVMAIIQAFGFLCGHGSGNYLSRMLGAGKKKEADEMASTGFAISLIVGICIAAAGLIFQNQIAAFLGRGATAETIEETKRYMRIILIGAPFMTGQFVINNQLRFQGSAVYAMIGILTGAFLNIILDPLYIFVLHMGVAGAAAATVTGQAVSFLVLLYGSMQGENIRLSFRHVRLNGHYLFQLINGGAPSLFRQGLASVSTILLNNAAGSFGGDAAIAGMSIVTRVVMLICSCVIGFGQGYQPVCSYNFGAGLKRRVREGYFFSLKCTTVFLTIAGCICFVFAPQVIGIFRDDPAVIKTGAEALRFQSAVFPLMGTIFMSNMMLQSSGMGFKASITSSARNGIFFIPLILILPRLFGLRGVEITQPSSDVLTVMLTVPMAYSELRNMKDDT